MRLQIALLGAVVLAWGVLTPATANAQTTAPAQLGPPGGPYAPDYIQYARTNVKGGAVAQRRPGLWAAAGNSRASQRQDVLLRQYGGATPVNEEDLPTPLRTTIMVEVLQQFFDTLNDVIQQIGLQALLGGGGDQNPSIPVN